MAQQIFETPSIKTQAWNISGATITWKPDNGGSVAPLPLLTNGVQIQQQASRSEVYGLNRLQDGVGKIVIFGPPQGTLTMSGLYAPSGTTDLTDFLHSAASLCDGGITVIVRPFGNACGADSQNNNIWTISGVSLVSVGLAMTIQQGTSQVNMPLQFTFSDMQLS